ncbi:MAG: glycosyl transferase, family 2, partial [Nocardioides sp.]|nr:glycosyl transferase, family 2 [Nocardioides sp.]
MSQPRVRRNDWGGLVPPALGDWTPSTSVSVVIPAYNAGRLLPTVLAGLAAQTYPAHLLEVVVADDGPGDELRLPEVRPDNTRVVRVERGWGRANACHTGAMASDGQVIHWLDADMLVEREHVEAQLRWHHLIDHAVVLGHKWFVDPAAIPADPAAVRAAVAEGRAADFFAGQEPEAHDWVEEVYARTNDLRDAGPRALRTHVGATASLTRELYLAAGGMDTSLRLGEDIDLGYRLGECGAVFIPDREARSWHLGPTHVMSRRANVNDYNDPFLADRAPELRPKRRPGRWYAVPYLEVVLDTRGQRHQRVAAVVDAVLASTLSDLVVTLLGDWSAITDDRVSPLDDPQLDARLVRVGYASDPRVRLVESLPEGRCEAMFRLTLPDAGWAPRNRSLAALLMHLERTHHGLRQIVMPDGSRARIERTAAFERARRVAVEGEDLDDVVDEIFGSWWLEAEDAGFVASDEIWRPQL